MSLVDVVVVAYNSRPQLRRCVEPLLGEANVIVVDNASPDGSLDAVADLPVRALQLTQNRGFGAGCNAGWRAGSAPYVLFLNPDAVIDAESLRRLVRVLEEDDRAGGAAPRILHSDGTLDFSLRRFPRLRSTYAQALFLHRLFPRADWTDDVIRDRDVYAAPWYPDWVSGACILVRRSALERLDGFDEGFFMYCEDRDLCKRLHDLGLPVRYEPEAVAVHEGGASAPRASLLPVLAASRIRYAQKHWSTPGAFLKRAGVALGALTHVLVSRGGWERRAGHARSLARAVTAPASPVPPTAERPTLTYAVVTPARDEAVNLRRLAHWLAHQTVRPREWVIVDNGSTDDTGAVADALAAEHDWIHVVVQDGERTPIRGAPVVRAFEAGVRALRATPDVVVKLDADLSLEPDYFERLLAKFALDPELGIASGTCHEYERGAWRATNVTEGHVRGASRAYRWSCFADVLPLAAGIGWDGVDALKANARGWRTRTFPDLAFYHHRRVGERDRTRACSWSGQGRGAYAMGYRFSYLVLRALHHARRDPAALAMVGGYVGAALRREPHTSDPLARAVLRRKQRARNLPYRVRETFGRRLA